MTEYELPAHRLGGPPDGDAAARAERLRGLDMAQVSDLKFDALARKITEKTGAAAAMVNFIGQERQYFAGLHARAPQAPGEPQFVGDPGREMDMEHGFCVHVAARRKALVLDDIYAYPRFAGNPVVDEIGVRSYLGAPLIDDDGQVIGTVCAIDPAPRSAGENTSWGQQGLALIKSVADEVVAEIRTRQRVGAVTAAAAGTVMIVAAPGLEVLQANAAHEQLFGPIRALGTPAPEAFPDLARVGVLTALAQAGPTGEPVVTAPVPLADQTHTVLFAVVPVSMPGQSSARLILGMADTPAAECVATAQTLSTEIGGLFEPEI